MRIPCKRRRHNLIARHGYRSFERTFGWVSALTVTGLLSGCASDQVAQSAPPKGPYQLVQVTAQDWHWTMSNLHLKMGEAVKFEVRSKDGIHGFSIAGTNVSEAVGAAQTPQVIYWTPPAKGTYTLACNVYCGAGHDKMQTNFTVS
ncbi:MAG: hypothetical protein OWT28_01030 [Firmicutes bacterium]|nr:hypothetical protein [Bacillota bacterium]